MSGPYRKSKFSCMVCLVLCCLAGNSGWGQITVAGFGSGGFFVESGASSGPYTQSVDGLFFGPLVSLGDTVGGRTPLFLLDPSVDDLNLVMRRTGANPGLPFTLELFDTNFQLIARYNGQTIGVGESPVAVPLLRSGSFQAGGRSVAGMQFTWDGSGGLGVALISLLSNSSPSPSPTPSPTPAPSPSPSVSPTPTPAPEPSVSPTPAPVPSPTPTPPLPPGPTPLPSPTPTPAPEPSVSPTPAPVPSPTPLPTPTPQTSPTPQPTPNPTPTPVPPQVDRVAPSVFFTSATKSGKKHYTLRVTVTDDVKPAGLRFRKKAPRKKKYGEWNWVQLPDRGKTQDWAQTFKLRRKGKWRFEVQAYDHANRFSLIEKIKVKRK